MPSPYTAPSFATLRRTQQFELTPEQPSLDLLNFSRRCRSNDSFSDRSAVNHFFNGNWKCRAAACSFSECIQRHAADIERFGLPHFGFAFRRLKFACAEKPRSSFFG